MQQQIAGKKITTIKFGRELTSGKQRQNEGGRIKYSDRDVLASGNEIAQFY